MWERGSRKLWGFCSGGAGACCLVLFGASALLAAGCGEPETTPSLSSIDFAQAGASASASAGAPAVSTGSSPPRALAPGTWAIVAEAMDATVVQIDQHGNGMGCQAGWPEAPDTAVDFYTTDYCGPVTGHVDGDQVFFDLALPARGHPLHYAIFGTLSARATRIGGIQHMSDDRDNQYLPGAAIRYLREDEPGPFPLGAAWPDALHDWYGADFSTATSQGPFVPEKRYRLRRAWTALGGDIGDFLGTELSFDVNADSVVVTAGPVEKTRADRPVRLTIRYTSGQATDVDVAMPSGEVFSLTLAPPL